MTIYSLPQTAAEAIGLLAMCEFEDDNIAELGDNLIVIRDGNDYTFTEEPNDLSEPKEVTFSIVKVDR